MGRTGCCGGCCVCTVKDVVFLDPDGANIVEEWSDGGVQDLIQESTQISDDGSPFGCFRGVRGARPPCRQVSLGYTQLRTNVKEGRFGFILTVTGTNSLPGLPGSNWTSAFNCTLTNDRTAYRDATFARPNCDITTIGTTVRTRIYFGALEGAIYEGSVSDGTLPFDVTQNPIVVNLVSQHDPGLTWPSTILLDPSLTFRFGPYHGTRWWRLYPELLTFEPNGSNPLLALCYDTRNVYGGYSTSEGTDLPPDPTLGENGTRLFTIVMRQGTNLALSYPVNGVNTDDPASGWRHCVVPAQHLNSMAWVDFSGDPWVNDEKTFVPDLSPGAEPIVFGIGIQANGSSSIRDYLIIRRLDNVCIRLKR